MLTKMVFAYNILPTGTSLGVPGYQLVVFRLQLRSKNYPNSGIWEVRVVKAGFMCFGGRIWFGDKTKEFFGDIFDV